MSPELIFAVKERIKLGRTKEAIYTELKAAGYAEDVLAQVWSVANAQSGPNTETAVPFQSGDNNASVVADSETLPELVSFGGLIIQGWRVFTTNWLLFGKSLLLYIFIAGVFFGIIFLVLLSLGINISDVGILVVLIGSFISESLGYTILLSLFLSFFLFSAVLRVIQVSVMRNILWNSSGESYIQSLKWCASHIVSIVLLSIYSYLAVQAGQILFIIPGIALVIYLLFSTWVLASGEEKGLNALVRSTELVYGHWWSVSLRLIFVLTVSLLLLGTIMFLVALLASTTLFFDNTAMALIIPAILAVAYFMTFFVGMAYVLSVLSVLYKSLVASAAPEKFSAGRKKKLKMFFVVAILFGLVVAIAIQLYSAGALSMRDVEHSAADLDWSTNERLFEVDTSAKDNVRIVADEYYSANGQAYAGVCAEVSVYQTGADNFCYDTVQGWAMQLGIDSTVCIDTNNNSAQGKLLEGSVTCTFESDAKTRALDLRGRGGVGSDAVDF